MSKDIDKFTAILQKHGVYKVGERDDRAIFYLRTRDLDAVRRDLEGGGLVVAKLTENVVTVDMIYSKERS
jgi:hypothetical protein